MNLSYGARIQVDKAIKQLDFSAGKLGLRLFTSQSDRANTYHDLQIMRAMDNLQHVTLEVLDRLLFVLFSHRIAFEPTGQVGGKIVDSGNGVELPVFQQGLIANHRLLIGREEAKQKGYAHLLRARWSEADVRQRAAGTTFSSEHAAKITAGWNRGEVFVSESARHKGVITQAFGDRGFAFAKDEFLGPDRQVWLHAKFAPPGFVFLRGKRVSYIVVDTRRGLQARDIRPV